MRQSLEPKYRKYVQGYGFLSFARKFGDKYANKLLNAATKTAINAARKFGDKYGKTLMDTATKTASKRVVQKTEEAAGDLIGNKIADKITSLVNQKINKKNKK